MRSSPDVLERPAVRLTDSGDHELLAHIVRKDEQDQFWLTGEPVTALCGKKWEPVRDPERFPLCKTCRERFDALPD